MAQQQENLIKIIILGSSNVGKTCILHRYFENEYSENSLSTIGIDFKTKYFKFDDTKIKVNYTDTAGQEKFKAIALNYLKGTDGAVLVFDVSNKETFSVIDSWYDDIKQNNKMDIGKILVGNKADIEDREVTETEGEELAKKLECKYFETSAKTGQNVQAALDEIAKITYLKWKVTKDSRHSIRISSAESVGKMTISEKKACCSSSS